MIETDCFSIVDEKKLFVSWLIFLFSNETHVDEEYCQDENVANMPTMIMLPSWA